MHIVKHASLTNIVARCHRKVLLGESLAVVNLLELEMKLQNTLFKGTAEPTVSLRTVIPLSVHDAEGNIFIGRTSHEPDEACVLLAGFDG